MKVGLNNKQRKIIPKLQLVDESSLSTGPYGSRCTRRSDEGVESQYVRSPYIAIASNKRKAIPKKPTQTMLDLNAADLSLDTKEDKFDQVSHVDYICIIQCYSFVILYFTIFGFLLLVVICGRV